jgi:2-oxoglutarate ferredoxin oxidoreductase subunit gamma
MARTEIRVTGFGGQGVVLSAYIVGRACSINGDKHATMIQSFGPEARGSACSASLVIEDDEVLYPYIRRPSYLVALSSEGYEKYKDELADDGTLVHEAELVTPDPPREGQKVLSIPSTRIAEDLGRLIVQNIVMLGFFTAASKVIGVKEMRAAVEASVPGGTTELNLKAFDAGVKHFEEAYGKQPATA